LTDIYVDGDACPVREEIYRVVARLKVKVFVVSNGSRPIRPPGMSNVSMVLVGDSAEAADDWIVERIGATDVCVTSDILLASRCLKKRTRVVSPTGKHWTEANIGNALAADPRHHRDESAHPGINPRAPAGPVRHPGARPADPRDTTGWCGRGLDRDPTRAASSLC
jgi:hypothetical protein